MTPAGSRGRAPGLLLAFLLLGATADPVVAQRGTDTITASQMRALVAQAPPDERTQLRNNPKALVAFLRNELLGRELVREAAASGWAKRPDVAAAAAHAAAVAVAETYLASQTTVPAGYPSAAELNAFYARNTSRLMQPRLYHLAQIFVPAESGSDETGKRKLAAIREEVQAGRMKFEAVPGSSDLGWAPEGQIVGAVRSAVSGLPVGGLSDPICIGDGCHLVRLIATKPAGPAPLAAVRDQLIAVMRQQRQAEGERAYADALLARAPAQVDEIGIARELQGREGPR